MIEHGKLDIFMVWQAVDGSRTTIIGSVDDFDDMENARVLADGSLPGPSPSMIEVYARGTGNKVLDKGAERTSWDYFVSNDYAAVKELLGMSEVQIMMVLCLMYQENIVSLGIKPHHLRMYVDEVKAGKYEWYNSEDVFMNFWHASNETPDHLRPFIDVNAAMSMYGLYWIWLDDNSAIVKPDGPMDVRES